MRRRGRRRGGVDDDEFTGEEIPGGVVASAGMSIAAEEHIHRVCKRGFVGEPGDEQRPRLGRALVANARVARVFGAHARGPSLGIGRGIGRKSEGELRGVPGVRRANDAARELLRGGFLGRRTNRRGDVEALGAQPAEPRRGDRVFRDRPEKRDGLRVVRPSRRPGGCPRVVDSVVPGSIPALAVAVIFWHFVVVSAVDVAEHAPDRERRRAGFPPPELVMLVAVVVVVVWRRGDVGEERGAIGAEVEGPRGGPPAPHRGCRLSHLRLYRGADIAPGVGAGDGAVPLGRGDDVVVRLIPNRVPVPLNQSHRRVRGNAESGELRVPVALFERPVTHRRRRTPRRRARRRARRVEARAHRPVSARGAEWGARISKISTCLAAGWILNR